MLGPQVGEPADRRYIVLCFDGDLARQRAALRIDHAAEMFGLDLGPAGPCSDMEVSGRFFLFWPGLWSRPLR